MKTRILSWAVCTFFVLCLGSIICVQDIQAKVMDYIPVKGTWNPGRRSLVEDPVMVNLDAGTICVEFKFPSPNVTIIITKETTVVRHIVLSAAAGHSECIDLSSYDSGGYRIDVMDAAGNHIWGIFYIE